MRVLVATVNRSVVGGIETYLRAVVPPLRAAGHSVGLLTSFPPAGADLLAGVPDIPAWVCDPRGRNPLGGAADWRPDVVYHHGLIDPATEEALVARFPVVSYVHVYYGTCISGTKCQAAGPVPCRRTFGPACLGLYLPRRCGGRNPLTMVRHYREQRRRLAVIRAARAVLVASRHMAAEMTRNGVPAGRVHLVPLPVTAVPDPDPPAPRPFTNRVLFVGRLTAAKGWPHALAAVPRAAAELGRPLTLVVAGDGPDRAKCEAAARRAGVAAEFLGWVGPERREAETRAADLLVVPSVWPEPFGLVGVEAGCVGTPAAGYAVGGIPDWLEPGASGESAPGDHPDPKELAAAMVRALRDPAHWQRLRVGAWETARRFSPDAHLDRLLPVLESVARV
jgi:glycosyltransferase involved in cell wall biosynthesis